MNIILASASPRRKELLKLAGYDFTIEISDADETMPEGRPEDLVCHLSSVKAEAVAGKHLRKACGSQAVHDSETAQELTGANIAPEKDDKLIIGAETPAGDADKLIIGADTIVVMDGEILGKPKDEEDAFRMLKELSGRTHQVYTGVTLLRLRQGRIDLRTSFSECTDVIMRNLSDEEIKAYIDSREPMDKAGAYGIQGKAAVFISGIRGDYYNVVGLPICRLTEEIRTVQ